MATLLRQQGGTSIGPIGIVTPTASLAKAQSLENSAIQLDQIRGRFLADQLAKLDAQRQDELESTILRTAERWDEEFYYQRDKGEEGLANLDAFMENHQRMIVESAHKSIQADLENALTKMRLSQSGSLREEQYVEAQALEQRRINTMVNMAEADVDAFAQTTLATANGDLNAWLAGVDAYAETRAEILPEEELGDYYVSVSQIKNRGTTTIANEQKALFEKMELEQYNFKNDRHLSNIGQAITANASDAEIIGLVQAYYDFNASQGDFATPEGAYVDSKRNLMGVQTAILQRDLVDLYNAGDIEGAEALLAAFRNGDDNAVLMVSDYNLPQDLSIIANLAINGVSQQVDTSNPGASTAEVLDAAERLDRVKEVKRTNPMSMMPQEVLNMTLDVDYERNRLLQDDIIRELVKAQEIGFIAKNAMSGEFDDVRSFLNLSDDKRAEALGYLEAHAGWSLDAYFADVDVLHQAEQFFMTTGEMPASLLSFLKSAPLASEVAPNAIAEAVSLVERVRQDPSLSLSSIPNLDIYEHILEKIGANARPEMVNMTYQAYVAGLNLQESQRRALEQWNALINGQDPAALEKFINDIYHGAGEDGLLMNQFVRSVNNDFFGLLSVDVSTGESSLVTDIRVLEGLPESYYPAADNIFQWLEQAVGSGLANTASLAVGGLGIASLNPSLVNLGGIHDTFKSDVPVFPVGSEAYKIFDVAVNNGILSENLSMRGAVVQGLARVHAEGFGLSMLAEESVRIGSSIEDTMYRDVAYTKFPFENFVDKNLGLAMQELLVGATRWARTTGVKINPAYANVDFGDHLDQGRITVEAVENFNPNDPKFQVWLYPLDAQLGTGKIPLFVGVGDGTWSYSGEADRESMRMAYDYLREAGIESDFIASIGGVLLDNIFGGEMEGSPSQLFEAIRPGDMTPLKLPQLDESEFPSEITPPIQ